MNLLIRLNFPNRIIMFRLFEWHIHWKASTRHFVGFGHFDVSNQRRRWAISPHVSIVPMTRFFVEICIINDNTLLLRERCFRHFHTFLPSAEFILRIEKNTMFRPSLQFFSKTHAIHIFIILWYEILLHKPTFPSYSNTDPSQSRQKHPIDPSYMLGDHT